MKKLIIAASIVTCLNVYALPYIEYKNEYDVRKENHTHHIRSGYKWNNNLYMEAGKMTDGYSSEFGYKWKFEDNWVVKGKFETKKKDGSKSKSKLETELRYTFD